MIEGVALNANWLLGAAEKFVGSRLDDIRLVGGGARSDLWCQVLADVTDRTIVRVSDPWLAGLRGAALFAALALDRVQPSELRALVPPTRRSGPTRDTGRRTTLWLASCRSCTPPSAASSAVGGSSEPFPSTYS